MKFGTVKNLTEHQKKRQKERKAFAERLMRAPKVDPMEHPLFRRWAIEDEHRIAKAKAKRDKREAEERTNKDSDER
ncbi:MAG: hypothetical protein AAF563_12385 [Pseudomonadota bacterium]